ncbi:deleted in lung and esophageal cancer protein 1 isoform X2 [Oryzias latipes]
MYVDPSTSAHRPASGKTQDISNFHVLKSVFPDIYSNEIIGENLLSNLVKTKNGRDGFHCRYVEELQQAFFEYNQSMKETEKLKSHLIQARAQAAAKEKHAFERMTENLGDISEYQDLFIVKSAFPWCVDENLLKANDLISPQDYLPTQEPPARAADKYNVAKLTNSDTMSMKKEPRGYGFTPTKEKTKLAMSVLDHSLTLDSNSDGQRGKNDLKKNVAQTKPRPKWKDELSATDQVEGMREIQKLKDRQNFLRNPRFLSPTAEQGGVSLIQRRGPSKTKHQSKTAEEQSLSGDPPPIFIAKPSVVTFTGYKVGHIYETTLELRNVTSSSRHIRVLPPNSPHFSIGLGRFPSEEGTIAPGMSCKYSLRFIPDSLEDYKDFLVVETQAEQVLLVPIEAQRPPPILTLPKVLDCGYCLVGGLKYVEFLCQNVGQSSGTFCIIPKSQWPFSNLRSLSRTYFSEQPPFAVGPSLFQLEPGDTTVIEVVFSPTTAQKSRQTYTFVCDNCQVKDFSIEGEGQLVALQLVSEEKETPEAGEIHDVTAEHYVRFDVCNPHSVQHKRLVIRNNVHLDLPFQWQIRQPNLYPLPPGEVPEPSQIHFHPATDDAFRISPVAGLLPPYQDQEFLLTFCPKELKDYHSVCRLVLRDAPDPPSEPRDSNIFQPVETVIAMEIEVKGSTEPFQILLEPYAIIIPGEIFVCTTTHRQFKMWNHSKTFILFQWEKLKSSYHTMVVEPPTGRIEENECFDFDLILSGRKPEKLKTNLICNIEHHLQPITLPIEVSFKGPMVTLSVPSVDFGLVRLGEQTHRSLELTNTTQLEAFWTLMEKAELEESQVTQISVKPCSGMLPPLGSCSVEVIFTPQFCQQFKAELELEVENGRGCHVWIQADVQSPQVCLLNCKLAFTEIYLGVPKSASVTLFNQTALPAKFSWVSQLHGKQCSFCSASFFPSSGVLGPNESLEVTVEFTSHADLELTEVAALCEVEGMNLPLILGIAASKPKKLSVSYSLPSDGFPLNGRCTSPVELDFGDDVILKNPVTRQLLITNQTAIAAPFAIEVEYFTCKVLKPEPEQGCPKVRTKLQTIKAEKLEAKTQEEFVSQLLADGRGAAFRVVPDSGLLGPFETQTVAVTAVTDMWGEYSDNLICKVGDLEAVIIPLRMAVRGCPLYFQMTGPRTDNQFQGPIIRFGTCIPGGDTVSHPLRINNPSTFDIRMDWETYNIEKDDSKLLDVVLAFGEPFPPKDADGSEKMRRLSEIRGEKTPTLGSDGTSCSTAAQGEEDQGDAEGEEGCALTSHAKKKLVSVHIRPHVGKLSDYPFCINPQQIVIPAKSGATIHVSFTPLTPSECVSESRCSGLALGFMSLDFEMAACVPGKVRRAQGLELQPVRVDLQAAVKPAALLVQMEEVGEALEFKASAGDLLKVDSHKELVVCEFDVSQTFQLRNTSEVALHFRMETQPPFSVLKAKQKVFSTSSRPSAGSRQALVLQPRDTMQVKVAFHPTMHLVDTADQTEEKVPPGVTLVNTEKGLKKLKFEQNLLIHYSNNSLQIVPLCAHLLLSTLSLSTDRLSFGVCYVGQTKSREITLSCRGSHTYWKSTANSRESHVFKVTPNFGLLRPKEPHGTCSVKQHLQISFTPSEDREFRAVVLIQAPLVKTPLTLELQGTGTFDEMSRCVSELSPVSI